MLVSELRTRAHAALPVCLRQRGSSRCLHSRVGAGPSGSDRVVSAVTAPVKEPKQETERSRVFTSPDQEPESVIEPAWTLDEYQKLFRSYRNEEHYDVTDIEGQLPVDLEGTFYRNGPGITEFGGHQMHCFDGHGLIARVTVKDGKASFKSRYVRTKVFEEETNAQKVLYRGFGSTKPGGVLANSFDLRDKPVANTSVLEWAGNLYALWEAHNPFLLDPASLETLGEETFGGLLRAEQPFTAHPAYDKRTGRLVAFSNGIRHGEGKLHIWEIDTENKIRKSITHKVGLLPVLYLHDFRVTKNWYIFHQAPLGLNSGNALRYLLGGCEQTQQIFFDSSMRGKWWLVPRDGGEPQIVETDPLMIWHYGNAFEDETTGNVVVDACAMDRFSFGDFEMRQPDTIPISEVARFVIDPQQGTSTQSTLMKHSADFPQVNPAFLQTPEYRYMYTAASMDPTSGFPFRRVVKLNVQNKKIDSWLAPPGCFVGEPIYVARKQLNGDAPSANGKGSFQAEDDGDLLTLIHANKTKCERLTSWMPVMPGELPRSILLAGTERLLTLSRYVVVLVSDSRKEKSSLNVFRAADIGGGPICKINLEKLLPMAFHCAWSSTPFQ